MSIVLSLTPLIEFKKYMSLTINHIIILLCAITVSVSILVAPIIRDEYALSSCIKHGKESSKLYNKKIESDREKELSEYAPIEYNDFIKILNLGKIAKATIQEDKNGTAIFVFMKDGQKRIAIARELDRGLVGDLIANNIEFEIRQPRDIIMASDDESIIAKCTEIIR